MALPTDIRLGWKGVLGTNNFALIAVFVNYDRKKFYKIWPGSCRRNQSLHWRETITTTT
jgi:hypothetical protein